MTDVRADEEEDRLPWLEAVDDQSENDRPSTLKMIVAVLIALVGIGAIVGGSFWLSNRAGGGGGEGEVIAAPEGDYKVRPDDPGGMTVEGEGGTAQAASAGADPKGAIDTNRLAESPVDKSAPPAPAQPQPKAPEPSAPAPTPAAGAAIQLGAFSSQAGANAAWKALSGRFGYLAPLTHSVVPVASGGKTLYRLRASGPGAANICDRLRVAGESCVKVD